MINRLGVLFTNRPTLYRGYPRNGCLDTGGCGRARLNHFDYGATKEEISESIAIAMGVAAASVVDQTDKVAEAMELIHFP